MNPWEDVVKDYDAVMTSVEHLRSSFPLWGWPPDDLSLEQNLVDLGSGLHSDIAVSTWVRIGLTSSARETTT